MNRSLALLAVMASLSVGCATASLSTGEGFKAVSTKHFTMYTSTDQRHEATLNALEWGHASLSSSFFQGQDLGKIEVLFLEDDDFEGLMGVERSSASMPSVPGGGNIGKNGLLVVKNNPEGDSAIEALTHLFINKAMPKAPLWFHEGFSAYARSVEYKEGGGQRVACFGKPSGAPASYVSLADLTSMPWEKYNTESKAWYKHTARSLVDMIMHEGGGKDLSKAEALLGAVTDGKQGGEAILAVFQGASLEALSPKVVAHGNDVAAMADSKTAVRGMCPIGFPVPEDKAPDTGERKTEPAPAADIKALIQGLNKLPGREGGYAPWFPADAVSAAK